MRFTGRQTSRKPIAVSVITTQTTEGTRWGSALQAVSQGSPCAEWYGDVGSQAVRLVLRTSQREPAVISAADAAGSAMLFPVAASYQTRAWVMAESQGTIRTPPMACIR